MQFSDAVWWRQNKSKMADRRHIEYRFLAISRRPIGRSTRNMELIWIIITCRYRSRDQNCNFRKFKMADGRHFENSIISISQLWNIRFRSSLLCAEMRISIPRVDILKNSKFCKFKMADGRHTENRFGYMSAPYWPINAKFGTEMKNHMQI